MSSTDPLDAAALRQVVSVYRDAVRSHAAVLNLLNVYPVPDGDTGTNMARTLDAVVAELDTVPRDDLAATCAAISHGSLMGARGNSGVILSQILRGVSATLRDGNTDAPARRLADALSAGAEGAYQAVLRPVEGTILTVARESGEAAASAAGAGGDLAEVVRAARDAGRVALDRTPELLPVLREAGVVDAGGAGYLLLLDALANVVLGDPIPEPADADVDGDVGADVGGVGHAAVGRAAGSVAASAGRGLDVGEQRYEVMYFCALDDARVEEFKSAWGEIGDSIVVVGGDGLWNCHVHTNDIGAAIEAVLDLGGRPSQIRVTDLVDDVAGEHRRREAAIHDVALRPGAEVETTPVTIGCAVVAVCSGDGIADLLTGLGVHGIVHGGQTLNPSTAELLEVVRSVGAPEVIVLPNNKNIIPVAEQIDGLTDQAVRVVPTRSMPEALSCMIAYDPDCDLTENQRAMTAALEAVVTGEVTCAVRDSASEVGEVRRGDWIGLVRGDGIVSVGSTVESAALALLDRIVDPDRELVTILTGSDADDAVTDAIRGWLADERGDVEVEIHHGGQPLYPYLFGVE